jgi:hypothetical protein
MCPNYNFINNTTNKEFVEFMTISEKDTFLKNNPEISQILSSPSIGDSIRLGLKKPDNAFRDRLREIKKAHSKGLTRSTVNTF